MAAAEGVFGEKIKIDSVYNCLINDQGNVICFGKGYCVGLIKTVLGLKDSNVDGDLKVEHVNKLFKAGLLKLSGNYTESNLRRVALSMDLGKVLESKLYPTYVEGEEESPFHIHLGHRNVDWSDQVRKGVADARDQKIFVYCPGRIVPGYKARPTIDFKGLKKFVKKQSRELSLYIQETF